MEGVAERNENCHAWMCILFLWSPIFPSWRGVLREMGIAMSVCVYYYVEHLFPQHRVGCSLKWELHCLYMYIILLVTYFPKHGGGCSQKWELQCLYAYIIPLITYFHKHVGGCSHKRELQCMCVCNSLGHVFPQTWRGCSQKWELQSICLYYSFDHLFPQHGECCREKWELQCLCEHIIPLITYFHNMEGVAHRNENCIVCICILFLWSPISPTWKGFLTEMRIALHMCVLFLWSRISPNMVGLLTEMRIAMYICILFPWPPISPTWRVLQRELRIAMSVCVYYSLDHLFPQTWRDCSQKWELQCICVYYSLDHLFPQHGGCCREKWELQCLCVHIIPLITYFHNMEGVAHRNENFIVGICILFLWSPISPIWKGFVTEMRIAMSARVYYSLDHLFPHHGRGWAHKWELQCLYVYFIPLITYIPNMEGLLTEMRIAMSVYEYYSFDHLFSIKEGDAEKNWNCNVCICILFPWSHISQKWRGLLTEMRIAMSVCAYYSVDHIFPKHGGGCSQKWELQCMYLYIIPLITYFPNM